MIIFPSNLSGCCNPGNEMWKNSLTSKRTTRTENSYVSKMSRVGGRPLRYTTIPWAKSRNVLSCNLPNAIHVSCDNNSYDVLIKKCKEMHFYISLPSSASRIFMLMAKLSLSEGQLWEASTIFIHLARTLPWLFYRGCLYLTINITSPHLGNIVPLHFYFGGTSLKYFN